MDLKPNNILIKFSDNNWLLWYTKKYDYYELFKMNIMKKHFFEYNNFNKENNMEKSFKNIQFHKNMKEIMNNEYIIKYIWLNIKNISYDLKKINMHFIYMCDSDEFKLFWNHKIEHSDIDEEWDTENSDDDEKWIKKWEKNGMRWDIMFTHIKKKEWVQWLDLKKKRNHINKYNVW